ncbi:MAG: helix-turn-helix transcriptional regulator [Roseibium sp.]
MSTEATDDIWERRRRNLRALIAYKGTHPSTVSKAANLSINTLSKFLRGENRTMHWETLEKICTILDISNAAILDSQNPLSDAKMKLYALVGKMSDDEAEAELTRLQQIGTES